MAVREITLKLYIERFMLEKCCVCFFVEILEKSKIVERFGFASISSIYSICLDFLIFYGFYRFYGFQKLYGFYGDFAELSLLVCEFLWVSISFYEFLTVLSKNCTTKQLSEIETFLMFVIEILFENWNLLDIFIDSKNSKKCYTIFYWFYIIFVCKLCRNSENLFLWKSLLCLVDIALFEIGSFNIDVSKFVLLFCMKFYGNRGLDFDCV